MESISPNIFVKDINKTVDFYKQLGFAIVTTVPQEGDFIWVMMNCGNVNFMFQSFESLGSDLPEISRQDGASLLLYIQVKGIRQLFAQIEGKAKVLKGLEKAFYGATEFTIQDINGYVLTFAEDE